MSALDLPELCLPAAADMHVHLRDGAMLSLVAPEVRRGGVNCVFVMPNLVPPVTTVAAARRYRERIEAALAPGKDEGADAHSDRGVRLLMSLYLHTDITPETIAEAAATDFIFGVKMYPQGVTTNSASGVARLEDFYPVFRAMEQHGLVLNLHGESPTAASAQTAEHEFLPTLATLHAAFPRLRIVLEHCSTAAAVEAVLACTGTDDHDNPLVAGTITAHHLYLTGDDAARDPLAFCKPLPKTEADRRALLRAVVRGSPQFFFAPHPVTAKTSDRDRDGHEHVGKGCAAGVYTQSHAVPYVLLALDEATRTTTPEEQPVIRRDDVTVDVLANFFSEAGRRFYRVPAEDRPERLRLVRRGETISPRLVSPEAEEGRLEVAKSRAGEQVYSVEWC